MFHHRCAAWVRAACALAAVAAALPARASDYFHVCRSADGGYEMNDGTLYRVEASGEPGAAIPFRTLEEKTLRRETGYCLAKESGARRHGYESRTYTLRAAFSDEGRDMTVDFICELASDGLPAAYTCAKQVVLSREGTATETPPPPVASGPSLWLHNGSVMALDANGPVRRFTYQRPRRGMLKEGVTPGTLLFEGERNEAIYSGVAYVFQKGCPPAPYAVAGEVSADDLRISMTGQAPRLNANCAVIGTRPDTLVFMYRPDLAR